MCLQWVDKNFLENINIKEATFHSLAAHKYAETQFSVLPVGAAADTFLITTE